MASGEVPNIFADDELENVINGLRNEVKGAGIQDTKENIWKFFIDRVRRQLKVREREREGGKDGGRRRKGERVRVQKIKNFFLHFSSGCFVFFSCWFYSEGS